jgi:hypothetical protein
MTDSRPVNTRKRVVVRNVGGKGRGANLSEAKPEGLSVGSSSTRSNSVNASVAPDIYSKNLARQGFVDSNLANFWWAFGLFCGCFILFIQVLFWTPDHYNIPATDDYRLIELSQLSEKGDVTDDDARDFVSEAIVRVLSLSHLQPKANLNRALDDYFTSNGREDFVSGLSDNGDLEPLLSGRFATIAELQSVPVIDSYRRTDGRYTWVYRAPVRWRWHNIATGEFSFADLAITVFLVRESQLVKSSGVAVDAVILGGGE